MQNGCFQEMAESLFWNPTLGFLASWRCYYKHLHRVLCSPWSCKESDMTEGLNWIEEQANPQIQLTELFLTELCFIRGVNELYFWLNLSSVQFSLSHVWLCDPMHCSTPGLPVHHQLLELVQTHVRWVGDATQPSHPLPSPSPPTFNLSQHHGLFQGVSSSH